LCAVEEIWDDGEIARRRELVGDKAGVGESVSENIGEENDGVVSRLVWGVGDVCASCLEVESQIGCPTRDGMREVLLLIFVISPTGVPP
jgi:hypothetical protein